jgi:hypothetical protein
MPYQPQMSEWLTLDKLYTKHSFGAANTIAINIHNQTNPLQTVLITWQQLPTLNSFYLYTLHIQGVLKKDRDFA